MLLQPDCSKHGPGTNLVMRQVAVVLQTHCVVAVTIRVLLQVLSGAVQVAKIAIIVGLTALATDKVQKEYLARQV
jgi:hypothetical protein